MIHWLHNLVWGPALIGLLLAAGIYYTWRSGFFQIRGFRIWWRATVGSLWRSGAAAGNGAESAVKSEARTSTAIGKKPIVRCSTPGDGKANGQNDAAGQENAAALTKFQTTCTALAATIGTGNIAGVATALVAGGPGAIFWMWVSALLGMMTAYAEVSLGIRFRRRQPDGSWFSGPCAYLSEGLHMPRLAIVYGILCLCASLGMGSMVQSNAVSQMLSASLGIPPLVSAVTVTALVLGIVLGGAKRIAKVTVWMVPLSAAVYAAASVMVLFVCRGEIPRIFGEIFRGALTPKAALGGAGGYGVLRALRQRAGKGAFSAFPAFRYGVARGVFSNEAGLGTLAGLHGAAGDTTPREQGMWAMFEVFADTLVICTMTALVILCVVGGGEGLSRCKWDGAALAGRCFGRVLGSAGEYLVSAAMAVFAFSTMIAWYFLGRQTLGAVVSLARRLRKNCGGRWRKDTTADGRQMSDCRHETCMNETIGVSGEAGTAGYMAESIYLLLYVYAVFLGCVSSLTSVWELSDIFNGLMAFPNLLALFLLRRDVPFGWRFGMDGTGWLGRTDR